MQQDNALAGKTIPLENREYVSPDPEADNALKFAAPAGFTGQGSIWFTNTAPAGWLICDGSLVNKDDYPDLWLLLGDLWGASSATQFYLPDLRQRVPVGRLSGDADFGTLGAAAGAKTVTLSTNEMPNHTHYPGAVGARVHTPDVNNGTAAGGGPAVWGAFVNGASGGGGAHNNIQPSRVVNFIIKT